MIKTMRYWNNIEKTKEYIMSAFKNPLQEIPIFNEHTVIDSSCAKLVTKEFATNNLIFPFSIKDDKLYVAMKNIEDAGLIERVRLLTRKEVIPCETTENNIVLAIKTYYEKDEAESTVENLKLIFKGGSRINNSIKASRREENAPVVKFTDFIITQAIIKRASDIHIEPAEDITAIRYRVDGILVDVFKLPIDVYRAVISRVKVMGDMDIAEKRISQDGKIHYKAGESSYDLRISTLPTVYGEKIVIRILYKSLQWSNLKNLNFNDKDYKIMKRSLKHSHGMILVTGPTGSGKSSTLYAMLGEINSRSANITTIEDPVEIGISGINQVNVNAKAGITFASGLRSILRQDPDIIMIGEIRDQETASIAVRAAITGHLVLSTLHTNDSIGAINRLIEMGVPRYLLSDAIISVIAQRLVRRICSNCKSQYIPNEFERNILNLGTEAVLYRGTGCSQCNKSGYRGRHAICETIYMDSTAKGIILKEDCEADLRRYLSNNNMRFLINNCKELVVSGITTFEELVWLSNGEIYNDRF
jgi:type IV pilus assembly protein PilB